MGTFATGGALAIGQGITGLALLMLARRLSPPSFGLFASLYGASIAAGSLMDFGSSQRWTRELASGQGSSAFRAWLLRRTLLQSPAAALFVVLAVVILGERLPLAAVVCLSMQAMTITVSQGALAAVRALRSPALAAWLIAAGNVVLLSATVAAPERYLLVASGGAAAMSWAITAAAGLWATRQLVGAKRVGLKRNPWIGAVGFGIFSLAVAIQGLDVVIVGALGGAAEAGKLAAVNRWIQPIMLIVLAYTNHIFPTFAAATSEQAAVRLLRSAILPIGLAVAAALAVALGAPLLVSGLLGAQYAVAGSLLRFLALASLPLILCQPLAALLLARHQERYLAKTTTIATVLELVLIILLARKLGAAAVPASWLVSFGLLCAFLVRRTHRLVGLPAEAPANP